MLCRSESSQSIIREVVLMLTFITDLTVLNQRAQFPMMTLNSNTFKTLKLRRIIFVVGICNICAKSIWPLTTCCRAATTFLKGEKCLWIALNTWQIWQVQKYIAILATLLSKEVSSNFYEDSRNFWLNYYVWYLLSVFEAYTAVYRCVNILPFVFL